MTSAGSADGPVRATRELFLIVLIFTLGSTWKLAMSIACLVPGGTAAGRFRRYDTIPGLNSCPMARC
jgi:hypothetical protein